MGEVDQADHELEVGGRRLQVSNPQRLVFPALGVTKLDLLRYYLEVGEAALRGVRDRPLMLKRYVDEAGIDGAPFFQKRAPARRPDWTSTARVTFPSGRHADMLICDEVADVAYAIQLGCIDLNPWPVRAPDLDHPDELRIDLDPTPEADFEAVRRVALAAGEVLDELGFRSFPKTSGSRGIHLLVRVAPRWSFEQLRRSALAVGREVERRLPDLATTAWWKEERHGVFIDYNQNARDRTLASAYSVRPVADGRVSCPVGWEEVAALDPAALTLHTVPARLREQGDAAADIDAVEHSLEPLLELVRRQEADGQGDAPWPPHFRKQRGEPPRAAPSRRRRDRSD